VKYAFIKVQACNHSVVALCRCLNMSRSGYYSWRSRKPSTNTVENNSLARNISDIHKETLYTYGSPRMHVELLDRGHQASRGRVERLMRKHGLAAIQGQKNNRTEQHRNNESPVANILNRNFKAAVPNKKWVSDITFIQTREGFLYLAVVLDLYSRAIVGWSMSHRIDENLVQDALSMAIERREVNNGLMLHSDQGSQYKANGYQQRLRDLKITCSMSRKGECHDNAVAESFFHSLKTELVCEQVVSGQQTPPSFLVNRYAKAITLQWLLASSLVAAL
jgi:putative transposase